MHYHFAITMTCSGCSGAIDRVLKRIDGLSSYQVDLSQQTADVYTDSVPYETVLEKIKKTGKTIVSAQKDGQPAPI